MNFNNESDLWNFDLLNRPERQSSMSDLQPKTHIRVREIKRNYQAINESHTWEKRHFFTILDKAINSINIPLGYKGTGRPSIPISEKAKICCIKQYNLKGARRSVSDVDYARAEGCVFIPKISTNYFNLINQYMGDKRLTPYLERLIRVTSEPLSKQEVFFAVDGTGFKTSSGKSKYLTIRTDKKEKREFIGLHAICGVQSKIIPFAIVARGDEQDINFFKPLVNEAIKSFKIKEVYADKAYLSKELTEFCASLNIKSYLRPKENTTINKLGTSPWDNNVNRYYEDLEKGADRRYTLRANIECCFHMIKATLGDVLRHKKEVARRNELLCRVICHNIRCLVSAYYHGKIEFPFALR